MELPEKLIISLFPLADAANGLRARMRARGFLASAPREEYDLSFCITKAEVEQELAFITDSARQSLYMSLGPAYAVKADAHAPFLAKLRAQQLARNGVPPQQLSKAFGPAEGLIRSALTSCERRIQTLRVENEARWRTEIDQAMARCRQRLIEEARDETRVAGGDTATAVCSNWLTLYEVSSGGPLRSQRPERIAWKRKLRNGYGLVWWVEIYGFPLPEDTEQKNDVTGADQTVMWRSMEPELHFVDPSFSATVSRRALASSTWIAYTSLVDARPYMYFATRRQLCRCLSFHWAAIDEIARHIEQGGII